MRALSHAPPRIAMNSEWSESEREFGKGNFLGQPRFLPLPPIFPHSCFLISNSSLNEIDEIDREVFETIDTSYSANKEDGIVACSVYNGCKIHPGGISLAY